MKKFLLFFLVLLSFLNGIAQSAFNKVYHKQKEIIGPLLTNIHGDYYHSVNIFSFNDFGKCFIYRYGNTGSLKGRLSFTTTLSNYNVPVASTKTNDNKLLLVGYTFGLCDNVDSSQRRTFISKIDTNGNVLFITKIKRQFGNSFHTDDFKTVLQNTDSSYCTFTDSVMYKFSKTGQLLFRKNLGIDSISSCLLLQNNSILLSARQNSITSLITISQNGIQLNSQPFTTLLKKTIFYDGQKIMGLDKSGLLYKIDTGFNSIGNSITLLTGIKDLVIENDTVYSISSTNYSVSDTSFNLLSVITNTTQKNYQAFICKVNNSIAITASCSTGGSTNYHSFSSLNVINKSGNTNFVNDIEISSLTADSVYCVLNGFNDFNSYLRAKVKIKNKGATIINEFTLNSDYNATSICGPVYYQQTFTQTIQPGDSVQVTTAFIFKKYLTMAPTQPTLSIQYCLFSTMPNNENDKFTGNDELCQNIIFPNPTASVKELNVKENLLNIFPNPFGDNLNIESWYEIRSMEVFNTLGVLVSKEIVKQQVHIHNINTASFIRGIYYIKIETEKGVQIKKVVKQ